VLTRLHCGAVRLKQALDPQRVVSAFSVLCTDVYNVCIIVFNVGCIRQHSYDTHIVMLLDSSCIKPYVTSIVP
jgi:hypothetical protein